jgi:hypothetical protein
MTNKIQQDPRYLTKKKKKKAEKKVTARSGRRSSASTFSRGRRSRSGRRSTGPAAIAGDGALGATVVVRLGVWRAVLHPRPDNPLLV